MSFSLTTPLSDDFFVQNTLTVHKGTLVVADKENKSPGLFNKLRSAMSSPRSSSREVTKVLHIHVKEIAYDSKSIVEIQHAISNVNLFNQTREEHLQVDTTLLQNRLNSLRKPRGPYSQTPAAQGKREALKRSHDKAFPTNWMNRQDRNDLNYLKSSSKQVIEGFLNIGEGEGWGEGGHPALGICFTRHMLRKYYFEKQKSLGEYSDIFGSSIAAFGLTHEEKAKSSVKGYFDDTITHWKEHAISRMVGSIATTPQDHLPFFEVIVNSARSRVDETEGQPFHITLYDNKAALEERWTALKSIENLPSSLATHTVYSGGATHPLSFLSTTKLKLGPNAQRLIQGLNYLECRSLNTQKVGNCWLKQPMRCLLVSLYLELLTQRKELDHTQCWTMAKTLYKRCHTHMVGTIEEMLVNADVTPGLRAQAMAALQKRRG